MEVQRVNKTSAAKVAFKEETAKDSISFNSIMDTKRTDVTFERLNKKMQEIESVGEKLADSRTVDNLRKYKKLVKDFMDDAVKNGLELKEQRGFSHRGSSKIYKLVKEVDKKLIDLTNAVLDKEHKGLDLLGMVGEIKGMLINIYT
ncbi:YaaR family protein [Neobacillus sp. PS3-34]|uniref:YaaR family protein n=1 Tax=Neobacillus sp. PS3-34 TaxID=3070678 RepID=UPI0027E0C480|nr:YaaR family protein [Neobacillus sp. PS3-34]WML46900.1 YaaR family protein [Neobacillus sp. PS3-34]